MTTLQEAPEGERLARIEATLDLLVRQGIEIREDMRAMNSDIREDMRESRKEARGYFFWTLGILVGIWIPSLVGLIVTIILKG